MKHLDLFSGIGGFALAARMVGGIDTQQFVEIDPYCQKVLTKNFPGVPIYGDITTFTAKPEQFDIITGGFPCQDNSTANQRGRGLDGDRSGLWFEMLRIIGESQPRFVVVENVPPLVSRRWDVVVRSGLESLGYQTEALRLSAREVGAGHLRKRLFIIAYTLRFRLDKGKNANQIIGSQMQVAKSPWWESTGDLRRGNSGRVFLLPRSWACGMDDGIPRRMDGSRLKALGNAVVPQVAAIVLQRVLELNDRKIYSVLTQ